MYQKNFLRKFCLRRVVIWISDEKLAPDFLTLTERLKRVGMDTQIFFSEEKLFVSADTLYITDRAVWASWLREQKLPVLAYLHEGNRDEQFAGIRYCMEIPEEITPDYLERVYRRYLNLPWNIVATKRCLIRETVPEDAEALWQIYQNPDMSRYTEGLHNSIEEEKGYIREYIDNRYHYYEYGIWSVLWKETGELIGRAGFSVREGCDLPELGFAIGVPWQRKGIAFEVCSAILEYGREELGFDGVQARVHPENSASIALCKKLGLTGKGVIGDDIVLLFEQKF